MLAKALAKESGATFINIAASVLTNKWFGESNKLVAGLFSLARKTQPSIIFIDEIDSFLRERSKVDHEATAMMKAEFMTCVISALFFFVKILASHVYRSLWDGLLSGSDRILILGATNRVQDIDPAFLRRMPRQFTLPLPDVSQREKILSLVSRPTNAPRRFPSFLDTFSSLVIRDLGACKLMSIPRCSEMYRLRPVFLCDIWRSMRRESLVPT